MVGNSARIVTFHLWQIKWFRVNHSNHLTTEVVVINNISCLEIFTGFISSESVLLYQFKLTWTATAKSFIICRRTLDICTEESSRFASMNDMEILSMASRYAGVLFTLGLTAGDTSTTTRPATLSGYKVLCRET